MPSAPIGKSSARGGAGWPRYRRGCATTARRSSSCDPYRGRPSPRFRLMFQGSTTGTRGEERMSRRSAGKRPSRRRATATSPAPAGCSRPAPTTTRSPPYAASTQSARVAISPERPPPRTPAPPTAAPFAGSTAGRSTTGPYLDSLPRPAAHRRPRISTACGADPEGHRESAGRALTGDRRHRGGRRSARRPRCRRSQPEHAAGAGRFGHRSETRRFAAACAGRKAIESPPSRRSRSPPQPRPRPHRRRVRPRPRRLLPPAAHRQGRRAR